MSLIERQAAIDALDGIIVVGGRNNAVRMMRYIEAVRDRLKQLPSAQPDLCDGCDRYGTSCVGEGCGKLAMPEVAKDINVPNNDCISRQAAINAIENTDCELPPYAWDELTDAIMSVSSAQPEIIYCKDCKHVGTDATCCLVCNREGMGLRPYHVYHDDYCSYAERRTDGTEQP